ncbi:N-acetylglucosamine related transporter [Bacteroides pyogenes DSM 20611 = JCM 6294]|uniref:N-acetylglucosamine related transporter n=1 Tax=Bacteroides pyogenes DSM 20611 = JCM 6294 TaxID=1121100 RepID=W4PJI8_9BACE|nr:N-acetylglucosamine related transporter [Bacteroides pyogenes DSM 20611 = JCM 6294]
MLHGQIKCIFVNLFISENKSVETDMETLCRIRDIYRAVIAFESEMEKKHHLCLNEGMLLCSLSKVDRLSSGEIAETLGLTNSNASKVIRSVEDKVGRTRDGSCGQETDVFFAYEERQKSFVGNRM